MKSIIFGFLSVLILSGVSFAAEQDKLEDINDRVNYTFGYQVGQNLKEHELVFDQELLLKGIQDALSGAEPLLSPQEMREALLDIRKEQYAAKQEKKEQTAFQHRKEGSDFLAVNAEKPGVVTLPSGLQYKVIREGAGKSPGPRDSVTVHYRGTLTNGQYSVTGGFWALPQSVQTPGAPLLSIASSGVSFRFSCVFDNGVMLPPAYR